MLEWIGRGDEQDFRLQHVADSGDDTLVQKYVADRLTRERANPAARVAFVERRPQQIGTQRAELAVAGELAGRKELGDWYVEPDGDHVLRGDENAHVSGGSLPPHARPVDVPGPVHPHVRVQEQIAGELHEEMLPA